jgi:hypothetical protein
LPVLAEIHSFTTMVACEQPIQEKVFSRNT